jgi:hypothetical protein
VTNATDRASNGRTPRPAAPVASAGASAKAKAGRGGRPAEVRFQLPPAGRGTVGESTCQINQLLGSGLNRRGHGEWAGRTELRVAEEPHGRDARPHGLAAEGGRGPRAVRA